VPRLPVDGKKVIEHRITFGTKERELLDSLTTTLAFKNIATPTVSLLKDVTGMIIFVGLMNEFFGLNIELAGVTDVDELMSAIKTAFEEAKTLRDELRETPDNPINARLGILGRLFEGIGDIQRLILTGDVEGGIR
tara:strand:+ start:99 stop:506 length:408 start_codon:yes stop_codon:yes gene_type:complete